MDVFYACLAGINLISGTLFIYDKMAAIQSRRRIPELTLHIFELLGGVLIVVLLMHLIKHKTRKMSYYWITYTLLIGWTIGIWYFIL